MQQKKKKKKQILKEMFARDCWSGHFVVVRALFQEPPIPDIHSAGLTACLFQFSQRTFCLTHSFFYAQGYCEIRDGTKYGATVRMTSSKCNLRKNVLASYWKYSCQQGEEEAWHSLTSRVRSSDVVVRPNVFHLKLMRCNVPLCIHPASSFAHFPLASGPLWKLSLGEGLSTGKDTSQSVSQNKHTPLILTDMLRGL